MGDSVVIVFVDFVGFESLLWLRLWMIVTVTVVVVFEIVAIGGGSDAIVVVVIIDV